MIVGDICIYINFENESISLQFWELESFFRDAAINSRKETENTQSIDCVFYQSVMSRFIKKATTIKNVGFLK